MTPASDSARSSTRRSRRVLARRGKPRTPVSNEGDVAHDRRSAGFTLLEVMVCLVILAIAIPAFLGAIAKNVQLEAMNAETNVALSAASAIVETVHGLTYAEVAYGPIPQAFEASGLTNDGRALQLTDAAGSTQVGQVIITEDAEATCKTVQVRTVWRSITGSDRSIMLMTEVTSY